MTRHGTRTMYQKGCHCEDCKEAEKRYRKMLYGRNVPRDPFLDPVKRQISEQKTEWMSRAKCEGRDDLGWIGESDHAENKRKAKRLAAEFCAKCPVRSECLKFGVATKSMGIWGGHYLSWEPRKKVVDLL